jgi:kojibiose phosphorylase
VSITPQEEAGLIEVKACLPGSQDTLGVRHWDHLSQQTGVQSAWLRLRTRATRIELAMAERLVVKGANNLQQSGWDVTNHPTLTARWVAEDKKTVIIEKAVCLYTSRDTPDPVQAVKDCLEHLPESCWERMLTRQKSALAKEWEASDVVIEGDDEAQLAIRFNIYQLLIAAPRHDDRVSIGAKTLSGFGYRGHAFWDTELFMLPFFTFTAPTTARNLLNYRYHNLAGAREKAKRNGYEGEFRVWLVGPASGGGGFRSLGARGDFPVFRHRQIARCGLFRRIPGQRIPENLAASGAGQSL